MYSKLINLVTFVCLLYDVNRTQSCDLEAENGEEQIHKAKHSSASLASLDSSLNKLDRAMGSGFERLLSFKKMMKTYFGVLSIGLRSKNKIRERQELVQQRWNNMLPVFCVIALSLDPLFCYLLVVNNEKKCIGLDKTLGAMVIVVRFFVDFFYVLYIIYRFRASVVTLSSQSSREGELVPDTRAIAWRYLLFYFLSDILVILPLPQVRIAT
jgi:cyclic nucleotide gated channel